MKDGDGMGDECRENRGQIGTKGGARLWKEATHHLRSVQPTLPQRAEKRKKGPRVGPRRKAQMALMVCDGQGIVGRSTWDGQALENFISPG